MAEKRGQMKREPVTSNGAVDQTEAWLNAGKTVAEIAPITGDVLAWANAPEDFKEAYRLIEEGYSENDLAKMGLGAASGALVAMGLIPAAGTAARAAKTGVKKGTRAFHATKAAEKIAETDVFDPTAGGHGADIGIHVGTSPYTSNNIPMNIGYQRALKKSDKDSADKVIAKKYEGYSTIPLELDPDLKPLRVPDMGAFKYPHSWIENLETYDYPMPEGVKKDILDAAKEAEALERKNPQGSIAGRQINYFDTIAGKAYWINKLRNVLNKHGYDSLIYKNYEEGFSGDAIREGDVNPLTGDLITEPEDSIMLLYPRQVKYQTSPTKDYTEKRANMNKGGIVKNKKIRAPKKPKDPAERQAELGDLELRADLDAFIQGDPVARLGYEILRRGDEADIEARVMPRGRSTNVLGSLAPPGITEPLMFQNRASRDRMDPDKYNLQYTTGDTERGQPDEDLATLGHELRHLGFAYLRDIGAYNLDQGSEEDVVDAGDYRQSRESKDVYMNRKASDRGMTGREVYNVKNYKDAFNAASKVLNSLGVPKETEAFDEGIVDYLKSRLNYYKKGFAKGGMVEDQMNELLNKDPVSGNDIPAGGTAEGVRDDVPAMLSEGEFVVPEYAVNYHGVEKLVDMLDEAKKGMESLDDKGLTGESDNDNEDDYDLSDITEDDLEFAAGGLVPPNPNTGIYFTPPQFQYGPYSQPAPQPPIQTAPPTMQTPQTQQQVGYTPLGTPPQPFNFGQLMGGMTPNSKAEVKVFTNAAGDIRYVTFIDGKPTTPIPAGFNEVKTGVEAQQQAVQQQVAPQTTRPETTRVVDTGGGEGESASQMGTSIDEMSVEDAINAVSDLSTFNDISITQGISGLQTAMANPDTALGKIAMGFASTPLGALISTVGSNIAEIAMKSQTQGKIERALGLEFDSYEDAVDAYSKSASPIDSSDIEGLSGRAASAARQAREEYAAYERDAERARQAQIDAAVARAEAAAKAERDRQIAAQAERNRQQREAAAASTRDSSDFGYGGGIEASTPEAARAADVHGGWGGDDRGGGGGFDNGGFGSQNDRDSGGFGGWT